MNSFNTLNAKAPGSTEAAEALGAILYTVHAHLVDQAQTLRSSSELTQDQIEELYTRAYQRFQQGHLDPAIKMFFSAFCLSPTSTRYLYSLALALEQADRLDEAITAYLLHALLEPTDYRACFRIGRCLLQKKEPNATEWFQGALDRCDPKKDTAIMNQIRVQLQALQGAGR